MNRRCTYCRRVLDPNRPRGFRDSLVIDHVEPRSRGGEDEPSNYAVACNGCNASKGNLFLLEWVWARAGLLIQPRGPARRLRVPDRPRNYPYHSADARWLRDLATW